jgi:hypothetical protein
VIAILLGVCGLAAVAGYVFVSDPFGWFGTTVSEATPSAQAVAVITETALPTASSTLPPTSTSTGEAEPTLTETPSAPVLAPTDTPQPTISATLSETMILTPTNMLTQPVSLPTAGALIILEDDFSGDLNTLWTIWGKPRPKTKSGPGDSWLDLAAPDEPQAAGVTTKALVPNEPGVEIAFTAQLNTLYSQHVLVIDWDKIPFERAPESREPGEIHLEIRNNKLILRTPLTRDLCQLDWIGVNPHSYRLKIVEGPGVELYGDEEDLPLCKMASIGQPPTAGHISISGVGWVTYIIITGP